jgi:leucyl aminopeptidase
MNFSLESGAPQKLESDCLIAGLFESDGPTGDLASLDRASRGRIKELIDNGDLTGKLGQCDVLRGLPGIKAARVLVVGLGNAEEFSESRYCRVTQEAMSRLHRTGASEAVSCLPGLEVGERDLAWRLRQGAQIAEHSAYRYSETVAPKDGESRIERMGFGIGRVRKTDTLQAALDSASAIGAGQALARRLGDLPANICTPEFLANEARALNKRHPHVTVEVLERAALEEMGMGSLLGVAQGSRNEPRLIVFRYNGGAKNDAPYAFIGKGITFDTGGISLKPGPAMDEMKFDMCGGASVFGLMESVGLLEPGVNVVGVVPAVENMPDGNAYRPGDVLKSMSGQTIEVLNTDAEGRLILCDALTYVERFEPASVVDMATLTGACVIALGRHASGLMSPDDELAEDLLAAGDASFDRAWRLPLWEDYQEPLDSNFADMANVGGKAAGAITAGCFLWRFATEYPWAHLDIAGTAWLTGKQKGATGRPVPLLVQYLLDRQAD